MAARSIHKSTSSATNTGENGPDSNNTSTSHLNVTTLPQRSNSVCGPHATPQPADIIQESLLNTSGCDVTAPTTVRKSRLKAKAKVVVQLESMKSKVECIDKMLRSLQEMSDRCQRERIKVPRMRNCNNGNVSKKRKESHEVCCEHDGIMQQIVDIETQVKIVRNTLLFLCRAYLLDKQIGMLLSVQDQMYPTFDISVRFFGIDWTHIFRVSFNLIQCVDLMLDTLVQGTSTAFTDVLLPSNILRDLATIEADVSSHAEAVLHGRLSKITQEKIRVEQRRVNEITNAANNSITSTSPGDLVHSKSTSQLFVDGIRRKLKNAMRLPGVLRRFSSHHHLLGQHVRHSSHGLLHGSTRQSHDHLWRAWYNGLQTVTIPAFSMTTEMHQVAAAVTAKAGVPQVTHIETVVVSNSLSSFSTAPPVSSICYSSSMSSASEVSSHTDVIGVYAHVEIERPQLMGDVVRHVADKMDSDDSDDNEDSFESLTLAVNIDQAPRQSIQESHL